MKKKSIINWKLVTIIALFLAIGGVVFANPIRDFRRAVDGYRYDTRYRPDTRYRHDENFRREHMQGTMNPWSYNEKYNDNSDKEKMTIDEITEIVEEYLKSYDEDLKIADIFVYSDTDYYVSIEESDTGKGAMELLINPFTGYINPEPGPNMMWNEKYGIHGSRGHGMMGRWEDSRYYENINDIDIIDREKAVEIADEYVKKNISKEYTVNNEGHEFYGYYTFHVNKYNETVAMLSVNYYTGDVFYHAWHGNVEKVLSHHDK